MCTPDVYMVQSLASNTIGIFCCRFERAAKHSLKRIGDKRWETHLNFLYFDVWPINSKTRLPDAIWCYAFQNIQHQRGHKSCQTD